jgi:hypothetical protein
MRAVAAIVVGLLVSLIAAVIVGIVAMGTTFSLPAGTDASDTRNVILTLMAMPPATWFALAAAWFASGFAGAAVAKLILRKAWAAWAVVLVVAVYFGLNAYLLLLPLWVTASWVIAPLLGGLLGNRLVGAAPAVNTDEVEAPPANP